MPVLKFDVSGSDPGEAAGREFKQARPGVYNAKVQKCLLNKPADKDRRIEITYKIDDKSAGEANGQWLTDYVNVESEAGVWRLDQLLLAFGYATAKKRKGSLNTDELVGKTCRIRVRADSYTPAGATEPEYRAKVGAVLPAKGDVEEEADDDELTDPEGPPEEPEEVVSDADRLTELSGLEEEELEEDDDIRFELSEMAGEAGLDPEAFPTWTSLIEALVEAGGGSKKPDDSEEETPSGEDYSDWTVGDLRGECKARELDTTGKRAELITRLTESDGSGPF